MLPIAFHFGAETLHLDEWRGHTVSVDFHFFTTEEIRSWLEDAGFAIQDIIERDPYPDIEHQSRRGYIFAKRTG